LRQALEGYQGEKGPALFERIQLGAAAAPLFNAAYAAMYGYPQRLQRCLAQIEARAA
jgi:hypothetical protein